MKNLTILWQRLVDSAGDTCPRCGSTGSNLNTAVATLSESLKPLGITVQLETREISPGDFAGNPLQSNRIWIAGKPLEEWLGASIASSRCCSSCGDSECRTMTVDGEVHEEIPASLIIKAALLAAASLTTPQGGGCGCQTGCCG